MLIKIIGMTLIISAGSLTGTAMSSSLTEHEKRLKLIVLLLNRFSTLINFQALHTGEILENVADDRTFEKLNFIKTAYMLYEKGEKFRDAWEIAIKNDINLAEGEKNELLSVGVALGKSNIKGQLSMLEIHIQNINNIYNNISKENANKCKLYRSLGVLAGIFISVMLV